MNPELEKMPAWALQNNVLHVLVNPLTAIPEPGSPQANNRVGAVTCLEELTRRAALLQLRLDGEQAAHDALGG